MKNEERRDWGVRFLSVSTMPRKVRRRYGQWCGRAGAWSACSRAAVLVLAALAGCMQTPARSYEDHFIGDCSQFSSRIPKPWILTDNVDRKDPIYGGLPHFSAPLSEFGVHISAPPHPDYLMISVTIRSCDVRAAPASEYAVTPCGRRDMYLNGVTANEQIGTAPIIRSGLRVEHLPNFAAADLSFSGRCASPDLQDQWNTCTIWLPDATNDRGLQLSVSAQAFEQVSALTEQARLFLRSEFSACALRVVRREP
jgi:hypothetical protein